MRGLLLAAGRGERLRPLTDATPKPLLEIGRRALIEYPLAMLKAAGIRRVAINVHHLAAQIQAALGDGARFGVDIVWSPEPTLYGTGGPLNGLAEFLGGDTFVVANSDTILDLDLAAMIRFHRDRGAVATLALAQPENLDYYSAIEIDRDARVRRMRLLGATASNEHEDYTDPRLANADLPLEPFMYCGVLVLEPAVLKLIPPTPPWSLMAGLVAPMVRAGLPVMGYAHRGYMRTVDNLAGYRRLCAEFAIAPPALDYFRIRYE